MRKEPPCWRLLFLEHHVMNEQDNTLAIELLVNHLIHLRSQVDILQEQLDKSGVVPQDTVEQELEENWKDNGEEAVEAFWEEFAKLKQEGE